MSKTFLPNLHNFVMLAFFFLAFLYILYSAEDFTAIIVYAHSIVVCVSAEFSAVGTVPESISDISSSENFSVGEGTL